MMGVRGRAMLWGALVADAAALGLHWLYDQTRVAEVGGAEPEFRQPNAADYAGVAGDFAHGMKKAGDLSHYGEQMRAIMEALAANGGRYDKAAYERAFVARFGYGGSFHGYIDKPTRATLDNLARVSPDDEAALAAFHGADDTQIPALSKLPPLIVAHADDQGLDRLVESAVRVTNDNPRAVAFGRVAAAMLWAALKGGDLEAAFAAGRAAADGEIAALLDDASARRGEGNAAATAHFALHCQLTAAFPSLCHNLLTAPDYATAVRRNILAGGDSCGRAIVLGAVLGAVHGIGGRRGIPKAWLGRLADGVALEGLIEAL